MQLMISALLFFLILVLTIPVECFFYRHHLKDLIVFLKQNQIMVKRNNVLQFVDYIISLCERGYKKLGFKTSRAKEQKYVDKIVMANLSTSMSVEGILGIKIFFSAACTIMFILFWVGNPTFMMFILMITGSIIAYSYPDAIIDIKIKTRQSNIERELPSVLNTIAIITDAGLSLMEAIKKVCECRKGDLINELSKVLEEVNFGITQKEAFLRFSHRCQLTDITVFVFNLNQNIEKGTTGISGILKQQSKEVWVKRKNKAKELGEKASIKLFLPMLILVFPSLLIFILGPSIILLIRFFNS